MSGLTKIGGSLTSQPVNDNFDYLESYIMKQIKERLGYGIKSGLEASEQSTPDMSVNISSGTAYVRTGFRTTLSSQDLSVSDPSTSHHTEEPHTTDSSGVFTTDMSPLVDDNGNYLTLDVVDTYLSVEYASNGDPISVDNIDYDTGEVTTELDSETDIYVTYYHGQERIDIVVIDTDGKLDIVEGDSDETDPSAPSTPEGNLKTSEILVQPKDTICIEDSDITNIDDTKGILFDYYNDETILKGDLNITGTLDASSIVQLDDHTENKVDTTSTDTTRDKHISNDLAKNWEDHKDASSPHSDHIKGSVRVSVSSSEPSNPSTDDIWIDINS